MEINLFAAGKMSKSMETFKDTQYLLGLVADQSPGNLNNAYWMNFFGRPTGFVSGPEKGARRVIYQSIYPYRKTQAWLLSWLF